MDKVKHLNFFIVFAAVYFFSLNGIGALPQLGLSFFLKNQMRLTAAQMSYFQAVTLLAWVIKPVWGWISDCFPIAGSRRKSYLLLTSFLAAVCWLALALAQNYSPLNILFFISICYMAYAFQDVVTDGLMVETGQPLNLTGQFQSVQWSAVYTGMIITALLGGYLSDLVQHGKIPIQSIFAVTAAFPLLTMAVTAFLVRETPRPALEKEARLELRKSFFTKDIWILSLFLFLWNFSPSFGTPFFYYCVDTLKFSGTFLGILQAVTSAGALAGSVFYGAYLAKIPMRKLLIFSVFTGIAMTLFYFIYFIPQLIPHTNTLKGIAVVSNFIFGSVSAFIFLALLDLTARSSPRFAGGTIFALLMSFYNLGSMGSSVLGGFLFPITGIQPLILVSAVFSLSVLLLLPYLPIAEELTPFEHTIKKILNFSIFSRKRGR